MAAAADSVPLLNEEECQKIYRWIDAIPLSRPKRNITRDFSDGGETESDASPAVVLSCLRQMQIESSGCPRHYHPCIWLRRYQ